MKKQRSNVADSNLSGKESASIIIFLESLEGNPKEKVVSDLTATDLNIDKGVNLLFELFQSETIDEAYSAYSACTSFKRTNHMNMSRNVLEYEHLYLKMIEHDMKLLDAILIFKILEGAQVTDDERKLAWTMSSNLNFEGMKLASKHLFESNQLNPKHDNI